MSFDLKMDYWCLTGNHLQEYYLYNPPRLNDFPSTPTQELCDFRGLCKINYLLTSKEKL